MARAIWKGHISFGLVEIPETLRVEALLVGVQEKDLAFDMPLRLVLTPFRTDPDTGTLSTFASARFRKRLAPPRGSLASRSNSLMLRS